MDPVVSLKRPLSVDYSLCIFCQTYQASVPLSQATDHGLAIVRNVADSRKKLRDTKNIDVIDRLENIFGSDMPKTLVWHKGTESATANLRTRIKSNACGSPSQCIRKRNQVAAVMKPQVPAGVHYEGLCNQ